MPEIFLISDTHFGHSKILQFEPSRQELGKTIEEHDASLVERWNSVVRKNDTVWHLGDVLFGRHSFNVLRQLNGIKKLVKGNHDTYNVKNYLHYFKDVHGCYVMDEFLLSHIPMHESQKYRFKGNIHGHMHSKVLPDPFYCNVSCEQIAFRPVPFHMVKAYYESRVI